MKISLFTPTHDPRWLTDAYRSLMRQAYTDWEWVLVPNGPARPLPPVVTADPRVRVVPYPRCRELRYGRNIGALKGFACAACTGGLLVELDHDDMLAPNALTELAEAVAANPDAGFFYSDCVGFWPDGRNDVFGPEFGWEKYDCEIDGKRYTAMRNFPMTARSLCEIFYCPNHVRAWTREAYDLVGGHNPTMRVIDDHELLVHTYLAGVGCVYLPRPLYLYRRHRTSATITDNALIQRQQQEVRDRHLVQLVREWCRREGLPMYDLGGAHNPVEGFLTVDQAGTPDIKMDVLSAEFEQRVPDNSAGCFRAYDFLEHIPPGAPVIKLMNQLYRQLAPGGWLITATPSAEGRGAFADPTHVSFWNELSFRYYSDASRARYLNGAVTARFQVVRLATAFPDEWHRDNQLPYVVCDMSAIKGQRQPGVKLI